MSEKLPAFQFYPGDWRKDPGVQSLDYEARGIWHELLCFMHESEQRGRLVFSDGTPMKDAEIAQMLGISEAKWQANAKQLLSKRVANISEDGIIYNRRMCREEAIRQSRREAGRKGGKAKQKPSKDEANSQAKRGSSSSVSVSKHSPLPPRVGEPESEDEKPIPKNSRAAGTNLRAKGEAPRQIASREKFEKQKQAEDDRREETEAELRALEAERTKNAAMTPEERKAVIEEAKKKAGWRQEEAAVGAGPADDIPF